MFDTTGSIYNGETLLIINTKCVILYLTIPSLIQCNQNLKQAITYSTTDDVVIINEFIKSFEVFLP